MVAESLLVMLAGSHWTQDPLWQARLVGEQRQAEHIAHGLPRRTFVLP